MTDGTPVAGYSEKEVEFILKAQEGGLMIIDKHFLPLTQEFATLRYKSMEVASALIILAYEALRKNVPQEVAEKAFRSVSEFSQLRIEQNIKEIGAGLH